MTTAIPAANSPDSNFEAFWQTCLNRLARGSNRDVYEIPDHDDKVLKVMNRPGNFPNWAEIVLWQTATSSRVYLAKIHTWSWSGKFLVMERLNPISRTDLTGLQFPAFLNDRKSENFGRSASGAIKALDYAMLDLMPGAHFQFPPFP